MPYQVYSGGFSEQCPKCGAHNPFTNTRCLECGHSLRERSNVAFDPLRDEHPKKQKLQPIRQGGYWQSAMGLPNRPMPADTMVAHAVASGLVPDPAATLPAPLQASLNRPLPANYCKHCARCHDHVHGATACDDGPVSWLNCLSFLFPPLGLYISLKGKTIYPKRNAGAVRSALMGMMLFTTVAIGGAGVHYALSRYLPAWPMQSYVARAPAPKTAAASPRRHARRLSHRRHGN